MTLTIGLFLCLQGCGSESHQDDSMPAQSKGPPSPAAAPPDGSNTLGPSTAGLLTTTGEEDPEHPVGGFSGSTGNAGGSSPGVVAPGGSGGSAPGQGMNPALGGSSPDLEPQGTGGVPSAVDPDAQFPCQDEMCVVGLHYCIGDFGCGRDDSISCCGELPDDDCRGCSCVGLGTIPTEPFCQGSNVVYLMCFEDDDGNPSVVGVCAP